MTGQMVWHHAVQHICNATNGLRSCDWHEENEVTSECCGYPTDDYLDYSICPKCKEHCGWLGEDLELYDSR